MQLQNFYHEDGHKTYKRAVARERPTTQKGPKTLQDPKPASIGKHLQLLPPFRCRPAGATADG